MIPAGRPPNSQNYTLHYWVFGTDPGWMDVQYSQASVDIQVWAVKPEIVRTQGKIQNNYKKKDGYKDA